MRTSAGINFIEVYSHPTLNSVKANSWAELIVNDCDINNQAQQTAEGDGKWGWGLSSFLPFLPYPFSCDALPSPPQALYIQLGGLRKCCKLHSGVAGIEFDAFQPYNLTAGGNTYSFNDFAENQLITFRSVFHLPRCLK